tara:strand:+ start:2684 stop:3742 length:1059 start_codon:yes stop_codon:yes gene_type:complete
MKSILITGGLGYIGSHTSLVLLEKGYEILIIDSLVNSKKQTLERIKKILNKKNKKIENKISFFEGDLRNKKFIEDVFNFALKMKKPIEGVIHFAGLKSVGESVKFPLNYWDNNVISTINLLKVMQENFCNTLIFSSSATIYGISDNEIIKEDSNINPINPYGTTKATIESLLKDIFNSQPDIWRIANLRYFNPIGAHYSGLIGEEPIGKPNNIFPIITRVAAKEIDQLMIFGNDWDTIDGTGIRDYIHVMDVADGHVEAIEYLWEKSPQLLSFNLGTGKGTSVLELINIFQKVNNVNVPFIFTQRRLGDSCKVIADNNLATNLLNWKPKRTIEDMCIDGWKWQQYKQKFIVL